MVLEIDAFLAGAQHGVVDVGGQDLHLPRRRNQGLGRRHVKGQRIAQIVVGEGVGDHHGQGERLLAGGAAGAPDAQVPVAALLLAAQHLLQHGLLEEVQLRAVAEEAGFVDGEVFQQRGQLELALAAGEQAIVVVEGVGVAGAQAALQAVLQKMGATVVEEHAALLIDQGLQQLEFGVADSQWVPMETTCRVRARLTVLAGLRPRFRQSQRCGAVRPSA